MRDLYAYYVIFSKFAIPKGPYLYFFSHDPSFSEMAFADG
jgi:hypothetical protein